MIIRPKKLYGIDHEISQMQSVIEDGFGNLTDFMVYGRIRRMERDGKFVPEACGELSGSDTGEHKQIFIDDTIPGVVGFYVKDTRQNLPLKQAEVEIIFTVKPEQLIGSSYDEKMLLKAEQVLNEAGYQVQKIKTGIQEVFRDFDKSSIRYRDMQPFFVFSFTVTVQYENNLCDID